VNNYEMLVKKFAYNTTTCQNYKSNNLIASPSQGSHYYTYQYQ